MHICPPKFCSKFIYSTRSIPWNAQFKFMLVRWWKFNPDPSSILLTYTQGIVFSILHLNWIWFEILFLLDLSNMLLMTPGHLSPSVSESVSCCNCYHHTGIVYLFPKLNHLCKVSSSWKLFAQKAATVGTFHHHPASNCSISADFFFYGRLCFRYHLLLQRGQIQTITHIKNVSDITARGRKYRFCYELQSTATFN